MSRPNADDSAAAGSDTSVPIHSVQFVTDDPSPDAAPVTCEDLPTTAEQDLARLYAQERLRLLRLAAVFVHDRATAEDLVQDAFAALQRRWDKLHDPDAAPGYLSVAVANGARSLLRRRRVALQHLRPDGIGVTAGADEPALLAEEHQTVVEAVRALPKRQQQVIALRYWSQLSEAEIAAALGISAGTVKSTAARGLASVERFLQSRDEAPR